MPLWLIWAAISVFGAVIWYVLYRTDKSARTSEAKKRNAEPELKPRRIFWLISGVFVQILHWCFFYLYSCMKDLTM